MKKSILLVLISLFVIINATDSKAVASQKISGKKEFKEHCAVCHPDGGNIVNPQKTLHNKDREANNVKTENDIIGKIRNPGPGMTQFGQDTISDAEAKAIAQYILKTFK